MISPDKHQKHPPIVRPIRGRYHRIEYGIYGTNCSDINLLVSEIEKELNDLRILYIDADHGDNNTTAELQVGVKKYHLSQPIHWNEYDDRLQPFSADLVLVNGNHYPADRQIVIIDSNKEESLKRREEQLSHIDIILFKDGESTIPDFVERRMSQQTIVLRQEQKGRLFKILKTTVAKNVPALKALVLAGGESRRMGQDKSQIIYHDSPQEIHVAKLCKSLLLQTYISKASNYDSEDINGFPVIKDRFVDLGALGAIMSAFLHDPNAAWLIIACDLPLIDEESLRKLMEHRQPNREATAYQLPSERFPEPLIAIYEPTIYQRMLRFLSLGYACPRKVLINSHIATIGLDDITKATNANTPEEKETIINQLNKS